MVFGSKPGNDGAKESANDSSGRIRAGNPLPAAGSAADSAAIARAAADAPAADPESGAAGFAGPRLSVRVMEMVSRKPVPGATLWIFDSSLYDVAKMGERLQAEPDWEALAPEFARKVSADARGEAVIPMPAEWLRVLGRHENLYGEAYQDAGYDGQVLRLLLEPDLTLHTRAMDAQQRGIAGIPLGLRFRAEGEENGWWLVTRAADAEGRAEFRHLQRQLINRRRDQRLELAPAVALLAPPVLTIPLPALTAEEQVLVIAETGSVRVRLLDPDRRPLQGSARVVLQRALVPRPEWLDEDEFNESAMQGARTETATNGEAAFVHVGVGVPVEIGVDFDGTGDYERHESRGPEHAGEEVVVELLQQVLRPTLEVRLLGADSAPLREADVEIRLVTIAAEWHVQDSRDGKTDAEGWLRHTLDQSWSQERTDAQRNIEIHFDPPGAMVALAGTLPGRGGWLPGPNVLGDLILQPLGLLAGGTVTDENGKPVAGATAILQRKTMRRNRENWRDDQGAQASSKMDGSFGIHGTPRSGEYRISVREADFSPETVPWRPSAEDHRVVLKRGRFSYGRILLDPAFPSGDLTVVAVAAGTPQQVQGGAAQFRGRIDRDGSFRCGPGVPDRLDLWLVDDETERVLLTVDAVASRAPDESPDPRLDPLDLRGRLILVQVVCRDAGDQVLDNVQFTLTREAIWPGEWTANAHGRFSVLTADENWNLWVQVEGYRRETAALRGREVEVRLRRGPRVTWRMEDPGVLSVSDQMWIQVSRQSAEDDSDTSWQQIQSGPQEMALAEPGGYIARLFYFLEANENGVEWVVYPEEGYPVEVRDLPGTQEIVLPWTEAEIREHMRLSQGG